jgi:sugar lactone lactonase YvrE
MYALLAAVAITLGAQTLTFTTLAGPPGAPPSADGTGSAASFFFPGGLATDSSGNVYVADTDNQTIRKITPSGVVTTVAGLAGVFGNFNGTGGVARFGSPEGVATDRGGNVYVADTQNATIRKITPGGVVTTLAGSPLMRGSADGTGRDARFNHPSAVAIGSDGMVYVADSRNYTIRKVTPEGVVTTLAGSPGLGGNVDGTGSAARFESLTGLTVDATGNVYAVDADNYAIRKTTPAGVVTTLKDGTGKPVSLGAPVGIAIDRAGTIYVTDSSAVRKITTAGVVTTLADAGYNNPRFSRPTGVAVDGDGNVYVDDRDRHSVWKINPAGVVTPLAGSYTPRGRADGIGSAARFSSPEGVATDSAGAVYVADTGSGSIRKITPAGMVTTLATNLSGPEGVALDGGGNVYVLDGPGNQHTIQKISPAGVVTTLATAPGVGSIAAAGGAVYTVDEESFAIRKISPEGSDGGDIYVPDTKNHMIRKITPAGVVTTLAGSGRDGSANGTGSDARFNFPLAAAVGSGNVYVADTFNQTIRRITVAGVVTTVGGSPEQRGSADGTGSASRFFLPRGIATDSAGNVYVADTNNHRIQVGRPALADAATIDVAAGAVGVRRQLDTSPQTATSWQWRMIRQPSRSIAALSSASVRNPRFTPDVADVYVFQLIASDGKATSITTVTLTATVPHI